MEITTYTKNDGRLFANVLTNSANVDLNYDTVTMGYVVGTYPPTDYYWHLTNEEITARPVNSASADKATMDADGIDSITVSNIPNPSVVRVGPFAAEYDVTDGVFEFTIDAPGDYVFRMFSFPYKDKEIEISAS